LRNGTGAAVGAEVEGVPGALVHHRAYPNPAASAVTISYATHAPATGRVRITDILGRTVSELPPGTLSGSMQSIRVQLDDVPNGIYFYSIEASDRSAIGSFVVAR
jgi:hypothetical protein